jgi:hypothetical protein
LDAKVALALELAAVAGRAAHAREPEGVLVVEY